MYLLKNHSQVSAAHAQRSAQRCHAEGSLKVVEDLPLSMPDQLLPPSICRATRPETYGTRMLATGHMVSNKR